LACTRSKSSTEESPTSPSLRRGARGDSHRPWGVLVTEVTPMRSWPDVPRTYILCRDDRTATPAWPAVPRANAWASSPSRSLAVTVRCSPAPSCSPTSSCRASDPDLDSAQLGQVIPAFVLRGSRSGSRPIPAATGVDLSYTGSGPESVATQPDERPVVGGVRTSSRCEGNSDEPTSASRASSSGIKARTPPGGFPAPARLRGHGAAPAAARRDHDRLQRLV
jgi:hypothetical protein